MKGCWRGEKRYTALGTYSGIKEGERGESRRAQERRQRRGWRKEGRDGGQEEGGGGPGGGWKSKLLGWGGFQGGCNEDAPVSNVKRATEIMEMCDGLQKKWRERFWTENCKGKIFERKIRSKRIQKIGAKIFSAKLPIVGTAVLPKKNLSIFI